MKHLKPTFSKQYRRSASIELPRTASSHTLRPQLFSRQENHTNLATIVKQILEKKPNTSQQGRKKLENRQNNKKHVENLKINFVAKPFQVNTKPICLISIHRNGQQFPQQIQGASQESSGNMRKLQFRKSKQQIHGYATSRTKASEVVQNRQEGMLNFNSLKSIEKNKEFNPLDKLRKREVYELQNQHFLINTDKNKELDCLQNVQKKSKNKNIEEKIPDFIKAKLDIKNQVISAPIFDNKFVKHPVEAPYKASQLLNEQAKEKKYYSHQNLMEKKLERDQKQKRKEKPVKTIKKLDKRPDSTKKKGINQQEDKIQICGWQQGDNPADTLLMKYGW